MKRLQGAALASHLRSKAKKGARNASLAIKRDALTKMQTVYSRYKKVSRLEWIGQNLTRYVGIAKDSLKIALYTLPILVLVSSFLRFLFWIF